MDGSSRGWMEREGGEKIKKKEGGKQCFIENGWTNSV